MSTDTLITPQIPPSGSFRKSKEVWGWAIYDFANTIFSMNILTLYFAAWVIVDQGWEDIWYSIAFSGSMLLVALTVPILGGISDGAGSKKKFLAIFTFGCVLATAVIGVISQLSFLSDFWKVALALIAFGVANYGFEGGLVFYNALLPQVSHHRNMGKISGLGVSLGYVGAIVGMFLVLPFVKGSIPIFGSGKPSAFIPTAFLFLLFSIPTFLWVRRDRPHPEGEIRPGRVLRNLWKDLADTKKYPGVLRFLISDFMFEDAIATIIIFMAVYTQQVMGFSEAEKTYLFAVSTTSAAVGSLISGWATDRIGPKRTLSLTVWGWILCLIVAAFTFDKRLFWILGSLLGIFLGSTWTSSRPLMANLIPAHKMGQFFGLFSLSGRAAAIVGPIIWGLVVLYCKADTAPVSSLLSFLSSMGLHASPHTTGTIQYRLAILALAVVMIVGWLIFRKVPDRHRT